MNEDIKRIQAAELNILREVLGVLERHSLTSYMLGGTLLGAVRHQGFIPWDDDIDIGLPRPDYERFLRVAAAELRPPFRLHTLQTGGAAYAYYFARVEDERLMLRRTLTARAVDIPVWIDVFPLDGVQEEPAVRERWLKKGARLNALFELSQFEYFFQDGASRRFGGLAVLLKKAVSRLRLYKLLSPARRWAALDRHLKSCDYAKSETIINFCGHWGVKEMFPKRIYGAGRLYPFADLQLNGPEDSDTVLTQMYGDYMTPPPEKERDHHSVEIAR